jgi:hypothetical protein
MRVRNPPIIPMPAKRTVRYKITKKSSKRLIFLFEKPEFMSFLVYLALVREKARGVPFAIKSLRRVGGLEEFQRVFRL